MSVKDMQKDVKKRRTTVIEQTRKARIIHDALMQHFNQNSFEDDELTEQLESGKAEYNHVEATIAKYKQLAPLNDIFYIWFVGPFGTINNFRLGTLPPSKPVDFAEINAALGQIVLVLDIISSKAGIPFKSFSCVPLASSSKMMKVDDKRTIFPLFIDSGTFSLFPKRNFNNGLTALVTCMIEIGEFITEHDPTLALPHHMSIVDSKIADFSYTYGNVDGDEVWTRAMKYLLANVKWMITWYTKNHP